MKPYKALAVLFFVFAIAAPRAQGASIEMLPSATTLQLGDQVEILIYGTGFPDGADGGDFSLEWAANLTYVGLTIFDPPWDLAAFDDSEAAFGYIGFVDVFSLFETPGVGGVDFDIAVLTLQATGEGDAWVSLWENLVGWSLAGEPIAVSYASALELDVLPIPEPGTAALLGLSLGLLSWARRHARV
jgi:hypothetical protein